MGPFTKFFCGLAALLPRWWIRFKGSLFGFLWFDVFRVRRDVVLSNLDIAFPEKDRAWKVRVGRESMRRFGANFAEFFTLPSIDEKWIEKYAVIEGWEHLEAARAKNKGVLILSLHMGAYDITGSLLAMRGSETFLISKFMTAKWLNDLWFSIRGAKGLQFIEPHGEKAAFEILRAIKKKASVVFVLDQFMGKPYGIETVFFGRRTGTAYGLAVFTMKTGSPVLPIYSVLGEDGKLHLKIEPEVETASLVTGDKETDVARLTQRFTDVIEDIVRRHPEEWLWLHKRWKKFE